ncbi:hypothetical protein BSKO_10022 [Bryopsis sp. KO-2023]|nr:hypothetical protein BSKO_10022 [Bryopsis sp. KO-2023]
MQNPAKGELVLPWAERADPAVEQSERCDPVENGLSLASVGLGVNDKIEWWGARIIRSEESEGNSEGNGWVIRYDAFDDFEEAEATVRFFSKRRLVDVGEDADMVWRKEGELDVDTSEAELENDTVTLDEVFEDLDDGESVADIFNSEEVRGMPVAAQMKLATGLQAFKSSLAEMFTSVREEKGPNAMVDLEDVEKMKKALRDKVDSHHSSS